MEFQYFRKKIADVKTKDLLSSFTFIEAVLLGKVVGKKYRNSWLVCEDQREARDNGYWFYKYLCENTKTDCYYAINPNSPDYKKVVSLGKIVKYGSLKHWLIYLNCEYNISSQKGGKPNAALCAFLELNNIINVKNVFLQHGVTISDARWLYSDRSRFSYFITATQPETEFIKRTFGYDEGVVQYTGFSRFDNLHNVTVKKGRILIMPSWRAWFYQKSVQVDPTDSDFLNSDYLFFWKSLLTSAELNNIIDKENIEVIFYPHRNMQPFLKHFSGINNRITFASSQEFDVQELLKTSELLITDYSSVFFDMVYMKKPVIFFQFDEEKFRKQQYQKGYFDYHNSAFGCFCSTVEEVIASLKKNINCSFAVSDAYLKEHRTVFEKYDSNNSQRIYALLNKNRGR